MKRRIAAGVAALALAGALPLAAAAGGSAPADSQYSNPIAKPSSGSTGQGGVAGQKTSTGAAAAATGGSNLPFTGFDAGLVAAGGIVLVGLGVGLRRFGRRSGT